MDPGLVSMEPLEKKYGVRPLLLSWHETRQFLFDFLPPGIVQFDSQVCSCWTKSLGNMFICFTSLL